LEKRPRRGGKSRRASRTASTTSLRNELVHLLFKHDLVDELHLLLYPLILGGGKRLLPEGAHATFKLKAAIPYPTGVVGLHYERERQAA
jgi:dihydrofolate reductase